ncbi:serine/threonine protein kinase [Lysobacter sp. BMK333-48F3]|uniref:serine/threonine-protein kinase n=1 Tax=Lysobacter sp. BMK333-48F3 TaxID=2867962 RepID=UPI001C8B37F4|nr:serine/threonine-protein kinase [Lysobacter sp. BMK333-48F3]MBX9401989.1 serine/threonine protein kinase [Lysobacter sp. BMK333-48F3]
MSSVDARVLSLFRTYVDLEPRRRPHFLDDARRDDPQAHALLAAMIAADADGHPLDRSLPSLTGALPAGNDDDAPGEGEDRIGTRLGPWRLVRKIGQGGMGIVYEALRDDRQYEQRVALKCVRAELSSPRLSEALQAERRHLARLQHPNITPLLDGGVDPQGHPWFALQYVEGEPIDRWCDRRGKTLRDRVALLGQVCDALAYAHAQGVLHQDLKPSNLLVTEEGRVQLLDFGLAAPLSLSTETQAAPLALTPGYTAPEIVFRGAAPCIASDLYSLGAVIAQLLTGVAPSRSLLAQASQWLAAPSPGASAERLVHAAATAAPQTVANRNLPGNRALVRQVSGDLAAIVERCLHADPAQRYRSADELGDDLQRWLQQRPVRARDAGRLYRAGRFLRRHRLALGLAGVAALTAAIGSGATWWQAYRVEREAQATLAVSRLFEETLGSATLSGLSDTPFSSNALLRDVETKVRALDLSAQPRTFAGALASLARSHAVIGDYANATRLADEAARQLDRDGAPSLETRATLASLLNLQARHRQARSVAERALDQVPHDPASRPLRVRLLTEIARSDWELLQHRDAQAALDAALALAQEPSGNAPAPYAELLILRGHWNARLLNLPQAEADFRRAIAVAAAQPPLANQAREKLVKLLTLQERFAEAQNLAQRLLAERRRTLGDRHPDTGRAWVALADSQCAGERPEDCRSSIERGKDILRARYGESHPEYAEALRVSTQLYFLAEHSYAERLAEMRRVVAILSAAYGPRHEAALRAQADLGVMLLHRKPTTLPSEERQRLLAEGMALLATVIDEANRQKIPIFTPKLYYARELANRNIGGDRTAARQLMGEVAADSERYFSASHSLRFRILYSLAQLSYYEGDLAAADAQLAAITPQVEAALPQLRARLVLCNILNTRANIALRNGDREGARLFLHRLRDTALRWLGPGHPWVKQAQDGLDSLARTGRFTT